MGRLLQLYYDEFPARDCIHYVNILSGGYFNNVFNVEVLEDERYHQVRDGRTLADAYCVDCRNLLGWKLIAVREPCRYYREGRFYMRLGELACWTEETLLDCLSGGANEQDPNDQDGGSDEQDHDQDVGSNEQDHDQNGGANEQNADQDGDANEQDLAANDENADQDVGTNEQDQEDGDADQNGGANEQVPNDQDGDANEQNVDQEDGDANEQNDDEDEDEGMPMN